MSIDAAPDQIVIAQRSPVRQMDRASLREYIEQMQVTSADDMLSDLNEPQRRAVAHRDGPLLVLAGPGSGKTRVITRRAAYLVRSGVPASCVLAITFTNKAADEMKQRIAALGVAHDMWIYTFHALGVRLLHQFGAIAGVRPNFTIYDQADQLRVVKAAIAACELSDGALRDDDAPLVALRLVQIDGVEHAVGRVERREQEERVAVDDRR